MNHEELRVKLFELSDFEKEIIDIGRRDMKLHFSTEINNSNWKINSNKLMLNDEEISVHKHDRFIEFDKHSHDYIEMMFVFSGKIHHNIGGNDVVLRRGDILLLDMNVEHSIKAASEDDIAVNLLMKSEFFNSFFLKSIAYNNFITGFIVDAIYTKNDKKQYIVFKSSGNDYIFNCMTRLLIEYYEDRSGKETAIMAYMLLIFNELIREYQMYLTNPMVQRVDSAIIVEMLNYINENYKDLSLKQMAKFFNYNSDYLGKQVKKATGKSVRDLIKFKKLEEAERLLKVSDMTIAQILEEINYSNFSYFYKQFKAEYGVTPDEYRKQQFKSLV